MLLLLALVILMALIIGANSSPNCIAAAVGGRVIRLKTGLLLAVVFVTAGLLLEGSYMDKSIEGGIVPAGALTPDLITLAILGAAIATALATYFRMPTSTSQSIAMALAAASTASGTAVNLFYIRNMLMAWIFTPIAAAILSMTFFNIYSILHSRIQSRLNFERVSLLLLLITSAYSAYALGANTGGFLFAVLGVQSMGTSFLYPAAIALVLGILFFSSGIIKTIGTKLAQLGLMSAVVAQLSAAIIVHMFTRFHIPVSLSHAIVGGIAGIGFAYGTMGVNVKQLKSIICWWVLTPAIAFTVTYLLTLL